MALVGLLIALLLGGLLWLRWSPPPAGPPGPAGPGDGLHGDRSGAGSRPPFTGTIERARDSVDRFEEAQRQRREELRQLP